MKKLVVVLQENEDLTSEQNRVITDLWINKGFNSERCYVPKNLKANQRNEMLHEITNTCKKENIEELDMLFIYEQPKLMCLFSEVAGEARVKDAYSFVFGKCTEIHVYSNDEVETVTGMSWAPEEII